MNIVEAGFRVGQGERMVIPGRNVDVSLPILEDDERECPIVLRKLILKCWNHSPDSRPDFSEIVGILVHSVPEGKSPSQDTEKI